MPFFFFLKREKRSVCIFNVYVYLTNLFYFVLLFDLFYKRKITFPDFIRKIL